MDWFAFFFSFFFFLFFKAEWSKKIHVSINLVLLYFFYYQFLQNSPLISGT